MERTNETNAGAALSPSPQLLPVSVIIPAYNAAEYLTDAVASIRAQTVQPQEIIVVDDGSTDATAEIAILLGVTLLRQKNAGVSAARNAGVQAAASPWIAFLDADDLWEPTKLERQWEALESVPGAYMSITGSSYFNEHGRLPGGLDTIPDFRRVRLVPTDRPDVFLCDRVSYALTLARINFIVHAAVVVSRDVFLASGGYDESMRYSEDLDWLLRAAALTPVVVVKAPLTRIRTHATNSSRRWDRMILSHIAVGVKAENDPERYPRGVVAEFKRLRPRYLCDAGMCLLRALLLPEAKAQFAASLQERPGMRALSLLMLTSLILRTVGPHQLTKIRAAAKRLSRQKERV